MDVCNGRQYYSDHAEEHVLTDACKLASGCFWAGDWRYSTFHVDWPLAVPMHINYKEVCALSLSMWAGRIVMVHRNSAFTIAVLNKGRSMHAYINDVLRLICWKAIAYDFELRAVLIPGSLICISDAISRLHEPGQKERLACLYSHTGTTAVAVGHHPTSWHTCRNHHTVFCVHRCGSTGTSSKKRILPPPAAVVLLHGLGCRLTNSGQAETNA